MPDLVVAVVVAVAVAVAVPSPSAKALEDDTANGVTVANANAATPAVASLALNLMFVCSSLSASIPSMRWSVRTEFEQLLDRSVTSTFPAGELQQTLWPCSPMQSR